jgi:hypothetical protein
MDEISGIQQTIAIRSLSAKEDFEQHIVKHHDGDVSTLSIRIMFAARILVSHSCFPCRW